MNMWQLGSVSTEEVCVGVCALAALCAAVVAHRRAHGALARYHPTLAAAQALLATAALCGVARLQQRLAGPARDMLLYGVLYAVFGSIALLAAAHDRALAAGPGSLCAALGLALPARGTGPRRTRTVAAALATGLAVAAAVVLVAAAARPQQAPLLLLLLPAPAAAAAAAPMALVHATFAQLFFATFLHRTLLAAFGALPALFATAAAHTALRWCLGVARPGCLALAAAVAQQAFVSVLLATPRRRLCAAWAAWPAPQLALLAADPHVSAAALAAAAPHALTVLVVWAAVFVAVA